MKEFFTVLEILSYVFFTVFVSIVMGVYVLIVMGQGHTNGLTSFLFGLCLLLSLLGFIFLCFRIIKFIFVEKGEIK